MDLLILQVDESELQDEPLQLRLMDHDTYSANDAIGKVVIGLAPLLARECNRTKTAGSHGGKFKTFLVDNKVVLTKYIRLS